MLAGNLIQWFHQYFASLNLSVEKVYLLFLSQMIKLLCYYLTDEKERYELNETVFQLYAELLCSAFFQLLLC